MLRIITLNLNGIRSAAQKGFFRWLARQKADIVCLQEVRASHELVAKDFAEAARLRGYFHCAAKPGYSGVAVYTRHAPLAVREGIGHGEFDSEGRFLRLDFPGLSVVSVYLPSGSAGPHRQAAKYRCLDATYRYLQAIGREGREYVLCGDWNIAHREIDLKNWRANQKNSGFLPDERAWLDTVFRELKLVDVTRQLHPTSPQYTWWSNRGRAWENNVGWRIDYQLASESIAASARRSAVYTARRFSDHAPVIVDYAWPLSPASDASMVNARRAAW